MKTRFSPVAAPPELPDPELYGVHVKIGDLLITGMTPKKLSWGAAWFTSLSGWWDLPSTTGDTSQYLAADGGWTNTAYWTPRVIELQGIVAGDSRQNVRTGIEYLMQQLPKNSLQPLAVMEDGLIRHCMVRIAGDPVADWSRGPNLMATWNIQLVAPDPRRLAGDGQGATGWNTLGPVALPATKGGLALPTKVPFMIPAITNSGQIRLGIGGTSTPNALIKFIGPVAGPGVRDVESGAHLWFDLNLAAGDVLTVDLRTRVTTLNGVSRRGTRRGQWVQARNGALLEFSAKTYNPDARMIINTQEAWI